MITWKVLTLALFSLNFFLAVPLPFVFALET